MKKIENFIAKSTLVVLGSFLLYHFRERMLYELQHLINWDSPVYFAVGRGILNGLVPYQDLFETKPPGMFIVSMISLFFTNSTYLTNVFQALVLGLIPVSCVYAAYKWNTHRSTSDKWTLVLLSLNVSLLFTLYVAERSGEFQTESFGAAFVLLYMVSTRRKFDKNISLAIFVPAIFLGLAIGFKEPFLLVALTAIIILNPGDAKQIFRKFVVPLFIAATIGISICQILGWWQPYFLIYLPTLISFNYGEKNAILRVLQFKKLWQDVYAFNPAIPLIITLSMIYFCFRESMTKRIARNIGMVVFSIIMASFIVSLGRFYYNHHYAFVVPIWLAFFFVYLEYPSIPVLPRFLPVVFILLTIITIYFWPRIDLKGRALGSHYSRIAVEAHAKYLDAVLDQCSIDRYLFVGTNGPKVFGFTKHSPLGPGFFILPVFFTPQGAFFMKTLTHQIENAEILVLDSFEKHLEGPVRELTRLVKLNFHSKPFACAENIKNTTGFRILYKKGVNK